MEQIAATCHVKLIVNEICGCDFRGMQGHYSIACLASIDHILFTGASLWACIWLGLYALSILPTHQFPCPEPPRSLVLPSAK